MPKDPLSYKKRLAEKKSEIEILRKISETINYNWNLKDILESVIEIVHDYTASDSCLVFLVDEGHLVLEASQNPKRPVGKISLKKGEGITGWVAEHKQTVILSKAAYKDERFKYFNSLPEDKFETFVSVPVIFRSKVIGVINVQHKRQRTYQKEKIWFLEVIASQVGGAIEYSRLMSETDFLKEALATRKLLEKAKGILMKRRHLDELQAHQILNKKSMDLRKSIKEVAEAIILSEDLEQ